MPVKPKIMKYQVEDTATGSAWTAGDKKNFGDDIPIMPVGCIYANHQTSAVTDAATHEQVLAEMLGSLEVSLTGFGLVHRAASGNDWLNLLRHLYGIKSLFFRGAQANDAWGVMPIPIPFWYPWGNENMGAPGRKQGSWTAWVALGTSGEADGFRRSYVADVIYGAEPAEIMTSDYHSFTAVAATVYQHKFIESGKLIGLLWFDTTAHDTSDIDLYLDGQKMDYQTYADSESAKQAMKIHGGDWAGGDAADADCAAENYTWISFGENPENWPELGGKELKIRATCGTAEAKRVIPVIVKPLT